MKNSIKSKISIIASFFLAILTVIMSFIFSGASATASAAEVNGEEKYGTPVETVDEADWWVEGVFERADVVPECAVMLPLLDDELAGGVTLNAGEMYYFYYTLKEDEYCIIREGAEGGWILSANHYSGEVQIFSEFFDLDLNAQQSIIEGYAFKYPVHGYSARVVFTPEYSMSVGTDGDVDVYYVSKTDYDAWAATQPEVGEDNETTGNWFSNFLNDASAWISEGTGVSISASAVFMVGVIIIVVCLSKRKR